MRFIKIVLLFLIIIIIISSMILYVLHAYWQGQETMKGFGDKKEVSLEEQPIVKIEKLKEWLETTFFI